MALIAVYVLRDRRGFSNLSDYIPTIFICATTFPGSISRFCPVYHARSAVMDALGQAWPQLVVLAEVAAAMLLGGMIGYERETANKPAGFRTHMMLAGACALLVGLGDAMLATFSRQHPE